MGKSDLQDGQATPDDGFEVSVHGLRRRWKPTKERLATDDVGQEIRVRIHRCCSWMQRVEELKGDASGGNGDDGLDDTILMFRWIALNSLYGTWNQTLRMPVGDADDLDRFLDRVLELDDDARLADVLEEHRKLVMAIFEDEYLTRYFWEEPGDERARRSQKTKFDARTWYQQKQYRMVLERLMERIYFQRCQLVHGAATYGSRLNRTAVRRCAIMLGHLIPAMLIVVIDHGADEDWGPLCYPPQH